MRILFATPFGSAVGGIVKWAQHIVGHYNSLKKKECEIDLLQMDRQSFADINSTFKRVYYGISDYRCFLKKEKEMIKAKKYDLFHLVSSASISLFKDIFMLRAAQKRGVKSIVHFHFGRIPELAKSNNWEWKMICKVVKLSDTTIVLDKASLETLQNAGFKNVVQLPNPIAPQVTKLIEKNNDIKRKARSLFFAGHGIRTKGVYELVEACKMIPNITLKMAGTIHNDVKNELYQISNNAGWFDICGELPFERVIKEMMSCDVFVLPTYTEGFPNVILESMAAGCAIVTTPVGAIPEMLEEENGRQYGIMVAPQNAHELKNGIETMLSNAEQKEEYRKNVQERVNIRYNIDAVWTQMVNIWRNTIK